MSGIEEGGACPEQCGGILHNPKVENCSCHINPPCSACTDILLACNGCCWEEERKPLKAGDASSAFWWERKKPSHDLGGGKSIFDYDYDSSSGSTMVFKGRYEGDVTAADIIACLGDGTFGHRGPTMGRGHFTYTKITD
ncbi:hypothetical protein [Zavarzinella formosa]|uniref:hypothetical protein n=1 Tax=Zavarzinella formosa TaxID=360055 RepID=UPI00037F5069|nr:hypothetical protein [Zavarzinella formosa]